MDAIREQLKRPLVIGIVCFLLGLIIGWFVIGWGIWPVEWTDAGPEHLRQDYKEDYLRMAIYSFAQDKNADLAKQRYEALGVSGDEVLQAFEIDAQTQPFAVAFRTAVEGGVMALPEGVPVTEVEKPAGNSLFRNLFFVICGATLLVALGLVGLFFLRRRQNSEVKPSLSEVEQELPHQAAIPEYQPPSDEQPMAQYMASYKLGDDLFDDSFSIDSPAGEFMGECGVGISDTIGVGDPKKVSAFEVWLFDKNDIQTVTKVLMSDHAYHDEAVYQRLAAKGEPLQATSGVEVVLETQTLQMVARVIDLGYGDGALPPQSFFNRFVVELAVWKKG